MRRSKFRIAACLFILAAGIVESILSVKNYQNVKSTADIVISVMIVLGGILFTITSIKIYKKEKIRISQESKDNKKIDEL